MKDKIDPKISKTLVALLNVKEQFQKTKQRTGKVPCSCGGEVNYVIASYNDHAAGHCSSCGISFRE